MKISIAEYVGVRIRMLRKSKNYTQEQLGEKAGLPQPYIGALERAERNISLETLERVLDALDCPANEFFRPYTGDHMEDDGWARETILDSLYEMLVKRPEHDVEMIQHLVQSILNTIDLHIKKNS